MKSRCVAKMFKCEIKMYHAVYSMSEDIAIILQMQLTVAICTQCNNENDTFHFVYYDNMLFPRFKTAV